MVVENTRDLAAYEKTGEILPNPPVILDIDEADNSSICRNASFVAAITRSSNMMIWQQNGLKVHCIITNLKRLLKILLKDKFNLR